MTDQDAEATAFYNQVYSNLTLDELSPGAPIIDDLESYLQPGAQVLEIGGGVGRNVLPIAGKDRAVTSVDTSEEGTARLREFAAELGIGEFVTAIEGDALAGLPAGPWDAIIMARVLHAFSYVDAVNLVAQAQALTRPGGYHAVAVHIDPMPPPHLAGKFTTSDPTQVTTLYGGWEEMVTFSSPGCCSSLMFYGIWRKPPA
ncbi:MAG TPA: class I SAM-dependent methyltransferase [Candidatus Saccharimonadia bacterium]